MDGVFLNVYFKSPILILSLKVCIIYTLFSSLKLSETGHTSMVFLHRHRHIYKANAWHVFVLIKKCLLLDGVFLTRMESLILDGVFLKSCVKV
jgi:hypothetical protein